MLFPSFSGRRRGRESFCLSLSDNDVLGNKRLPQCAGMLGALGRTAVTGMIGPCRQGGEKIVKISKSARVLWGLDSNSGGIRHVLSLIRMSNFESWEGCSWLLS